MLLASHRLGLSAGLWSFGAMSAGSSAAAGCWGRPLAHNRSARDPLNIQLHTLQARGLSSAMSAASSACDHVRDWMLGTPEGTWVSMGVYSDGR